jgi:hypothetical protein
MLYKRTGVQLELFTLLYCPSTNRGPNVCTTGTSVHSAKVVLPQHSCQMSPWHSLMPCICAVNTLAISSTKHVGSIDMSCVGLYALWNWVGRTAFSNTWQHLMIGKHVNQHSYHTLPPAVTFIDVIRTVPFCFTSLFICVMLCHRYTCARSVLQLMEPHLSAGTHLAVDCSCVIIASFSMLHAQLC